MTIRWKLNVAFLALVMVFLVAAGVTIQAVRVTAEQSRSHARTRELAQYAANVRTLIFAQVAAAADPRRLPADTAEVDWAATALDDIDVNARLAESPRERELWTALRGDILALAEALGADRPPADTAPLVRRGEQRLRDLHQLYELSQYEAAVAIARSSFHAQVAIGGAAAVTVLLLLVYMIMVRRWLIRPIDVLRGSIETIGRGDLAHRVPLAGRDELSALARGVDGMAAGLAAHQAELVRAREFSAIGEMCANIAHGLRNPLAAIRSGAQLAARRANGSAGIRESFDDLAGQADLMDQRITRLFQFSRPLELQPAPTTFAELSAAAQAQARTVLTARQVRARVEDRTAGTPWLLDGERVAEALAELMMNAAHHSPPGAEVTVTGWADGKSPDVLHVEVRDEGAGMSPATSAKAFDTFFTTRPGGTGMGLALVRKLVEKHGGTIALESTLNQGTSIQVTLPTAVPSARATR